MYSSVPTMVCQRQCRGMRSRPGTQMPCSNNSSNSNSNDCSISNEDNNKNCNKSSKTKAQQEWHSIQVAALRPLIFVITDVHGEHFYNTSMLLITFLTLRLHDVHINLDSKQRRWLRSVPAASAVNTSTLSDTGPSCILRQCVGSPVTSKL